MNNILFILAYILLSLFCILVLGIIALTIHRLWHFKKTQGDNYFSLTLAERRKFKKNIKRQSKILYPIAFVVSKIINLKRLPNFSYASSDGQVFYGPQGLSNPAAFKRCKNYQATTSDIFVATQMKCGTTWMQQIVFQILHHGKGEFNDGEYRHMYAISPWIEMSPNGSVPIEKAPLISSYQKRLIKTHMPVQLCPVNDQAKYIYVARHPASCFASTVDFFELLTGPICPSRENLLRFFNSDKMWWGSWINHVQDWAKKSEEASNILFVTFEDIKINTKDVVQKIATFLDVKLSEQELDAVLEKIDFQYMKANDEYFEMAAPNIFSEASNKGKGFFVKGNKQRHEDVNNNEKVEIINYCKNNVKDKNAAWLDSYPELRP